MDKDKCKYRYYGLVATFILCFFSSLMFCVGMIYSMSISSEDLLMSMMAAGGLLLVILSTIGFLIFIGLLASMLERSLLKWVGGSFLVMHLFPLLGLIWAFVAIRGQVKNSNCFTSP